MDISKITTAVLKNVLKLTEKRESLLSELAKVEQTIASAYGAKASAASAKPTARRGRAPKAAPVKKTAARSAKSNGRRGALKDSIIDALQAAGEKGIGVKELSEKLGVKNQNVHVWFSSTGRKLANIQKVGAGKYRWKA
jgi:nucleoid-associated protein YgaU